MNSKDKFGQTPFFWAAAAGSEDIVKHLLMRGDIEVDSKDKDDRTPLFHATLAGQEHIVKLLLAREDVNASQ